MKERESKRLEREKKKEKVKDLKERESKRLEREKKGRERK